MFFRRGEQRRQRDETTKWCWCSYILIGISCVRSGICAAEVPVDFRTQIVPVFEQHCMRCHSPGSRKGDLSLATSADLEANDFVAAGDPDNSHLLDLVISVDGRPPAMPKGADPLSEDEVSLLRRWIGEGALWPADVVVRDTSRADTTWWSLQSLEPPVRSAKAVDTGSPVTAKTQSLTIDDFILEKLAENELSLNPPADRQTLIRRATFDLIGLPPTPKGIEAFVHDPDPQAYSKLIDRLLDSPHYGERWGRHWLDVVRFGESAGYEQNIIINNLWPFRDYVIRSINEDKPFNQFIREHVAGDVFGQHDPDVAVGSAFLVAGPYDSVGNQDAVQAAQIRANTLDEIIRATGEAFLGMTLGCARCHDHKFDPITQRDYYGLYATFSGVRHGSAELATHEARAERLVRLGPLNERKSLLERDLEGLRSAILRRAKGHLEDHKSRWIRPRVDRTGTEDRFKPVTAKFVRLVCESQDLDPANTSGFCIDEFEVWSASVSGPDDESSNPDERRNVALAANGGQATGRARKIEDFPNAYGVQHVNDGKFGARFISIGNNLTIELDQPTLIDRVTFSSARGEQTPQQRKFVFVADYRIEVSDDGESWFGVASSDDRKPVDGVGHLNRRLLQVEATAEEQSRQLRIMEELKATNQQILEIPALPSVWVGKRVAQDAQGPFHIFVGGSPQNKGKEVVPASLSMFSDGPATSLSSGQIDAREAGSPETQESTGIGAAGYRLSAEIPESERRAALANWIVHSGNPLTPRVLANRLWHYHFGTGIVNTPSDFGYMGGKPTHPELLDFLARKLMHGGWRLKSLHRLIMNSRTYQQSSEFHVHAAGIDSESRLLWRFPPRRLSAEEIRDTVLSVSGKLVRSHTGQNPQNSGHSNNSSVPDGGPGFRLYRFMRDNVSTYAPLDAHGPETYRRAVYHQNARASLVDLMTEFDQPDCTFSTPKRAETTSPLQALTLLNHSFTFDMAHAFAERLKRDANDHPNQIRRGFLLCCSRYPTASEVTSCRELIREHGLTALCRVLLNTSEMIYVR